MKTFTLKFPDETGQLIGPIETIEREPMLDLVEAWYGMDDPEAELEMFLREHGRLK